MKNDIQHNSMGYINNPQLEYKYSAHTASGDIEREGKCRKLDFYHPDEYNGQLSSSTNFDILHKSN